MENLYYPSDVRWVIIAESVRGIGNMIFSDMNRCYSCSLNPCDYGIEYVVRCSATDTYYWRDSFC